jgi:hypothetical protein
MWGPLCVGEAQGSRLKWVLRCAKEGSQNNFSCSYILVEECDAVPQRNYSVPVAVFSQFDKGPRKFFSRLTSSATLSNPPPSRRAVKADTSREGLSTNNTYCDLTYRYLARSPPSQGPRTQGPRLGAELYTLCPYFFVAQHWDVTTRAISHTKWHCIQ